MFSRSPSPTIARKLIVSIVLFSSCFTLVFTGLQLLGDYRQDLRAIDDIFDLIERGHLDVIANSLWAFDQNQLDLVLKGVLSSGYIHQVAVDADGMSKTFGQVATGDVITKSYAITYSRDGDAIELGVLRVTASLGGVYARLLEKLWVTLAGNAVKTFAVSILVFLLFQRLITRHLDTIAAYSRKLDEAGFDAPLALQRRSGIGDELDRVVAAINEMRVNLRNSYRELETLNETLEERVEERTHALAESEGRLQSFIKNSPGAVSIKSVEGRYLLVNPVFENIFGMTSDAILGKRAKDLVGPSFAASSEAHDRAVIETGEVVEREESLDLGQQVLELFSVKFPLHDNRGAITAIGAIQIDITERKRAEKALRHAHDELEERVDSRTAELRESEQSLANAQRIAHVGNWEWNIVTGELHWSDEIYRIFGLGPREFGATYEAFLEAVHPDDRTLVTTAVNQAIASHEPYSIEHRLLRPDGVVRFVHERGEVIYDDDDQPLRMSGTIQDITERKRVEERFRRYFDLPLVGSAIYAPDKTWIAVNDALCDLLGYSREELMEITWPEITHPDDLAENLRLFEAALSGTGSDAYTMDKRFIRKDGGVIHTIICGECVRKPDGAPDYFLVLVQDITERKTAVEELRQSEQSLANAQRIAHMGSWDWNLVTNKMLWSDESFHIYGLNRQDVSATHDTFLNAVHPDDSTLLDDAINDAIESHKPYSVEFRLRRPDGTVRFVHERGEVNYGGDDTPLRMSGTVQDVTERKAAEEALRKSQAWLSKAQSRAKLGFWDWSFDGGGTEHWSDNSAEILGFPTDDFYGGYEKYLEMVHPDDRGFVREAYHLHYPDNDDDSSG
jgi:PAS domain S-box-containing protein